MILEFIVAQRGALIHSLELSNEVLKYPVSQMASDLQAFKLLISSFQSE